MASLAQRKAWGHLHLFLSGARLARPTSFGLIAPWPRVAQLSLLIMLTHMPVCLLLRQWRERLVRWPVRAERLAGDAKCQGQQRQLKEAAARERWLQELQQLLSQAQLPAAAGGSSARAAKGRRASTLGGHVRTWRRVADWVQTVFGCRWPSSDQFVAYLVARAAEPWWQDRADAMLQNLAVYGSSGWSGTWGTHQFSSGSVEYSRRSWRSVWVLKN